MSYKRRRKLRSPQETTEFIEKYEQMIEQQRQELLIINQFNDKMKDAIINRNYSEISRLYEKLKNNEPPKNYQGISNICS